jgi:predicted transposase YdaD
VAARVEAIPELRVQSNVAASAGILAGLLLKRDFINQVLRRDIMQESVIYQEWREEFLQEGEERGERSLILRQLARRIGEVSSEMRAQIQGLPLAQLESLGEALLYFSSQNDLEEWLQSQGVSTAELHP